MGDAVKSVGQDHLGRVFDQTIDWYKNADAKAQAILAFDGLFITFIASALFTKPTEVHDIVGTFGGDTWLLLAAMCLILAASIITALCCLWSRIYSMSAMNELLKRTCTNPNVPSTYSPEVMSFFQHVSYLKPDGIAARLRMADADFELLAWSYQLVALSKNVTRKHAWVNRAFVLGALSLGLFLASAVSYIVRQ